MILIGLLRWVHVPTNRAIYNANRNKVLPLFAVLRFSAKITLYTYNCDTYYSCTYLLTVGLYFMFSVTTLTVLHN